LGVAATPGAAFPLSAWNLLASIERQRAGISRLPLFGPEFRVGRQAALTMYVLEQFWRLCDEALQASERDVWLHAAVIEPACLQILQLISEHPERRQDFEQAFCELWRKRGVYTCDILSFCMHTLRWSNVREFMEREYRAALATKPNDSLFIRIMDVLESFTDEWDKTDLFPHYDKNAT
jgi:hypothetical protein